jgi:membrane protease YdiL (CAAX protease family)
MRADFVAKAAGFRPRGVAAVLVAVPVLANAASFTLFAPLFAPGRSPSPADFQRATTIAALAILAIEMLGLVWVAANVRAEGGSLRAIVNLRRDRWRAYCAAALIASPPTLLAGWLYLAAQAGAGIDASPTRMSAAEAALWYAAIPVTAALAEETIWRGYAIPRIQGAWRSLVLAGLSFAAFHGLAQPLALVATFLQALAWGWAFRRTGSTAPGMALHFLSRYLALAPGLP